MRFGGFTLRIRCSATGQSCTSPPVNRRARRRPLASASACIFVLRPPRERPTACFCSPLWMARPSAELAGGDSELGRLSMAIAVLGIDLGKNSCSVVGLDGTGQVILRRRMQRKSIAVLGAKLSPCVIAMEACCGAHHLGRVL